MLQTLLAVVLAYVLIALAVMLGQRKLIYFPTRLAIRAAEQLAAQEGFRPWHNSTGELIGWQRPSRGTAAGTILIMHGNAGCAVDRGYLAEPLQQAAPLDVYILEYPGYGPRGGAPSQTSFLAAAREAFTLLPKNLPIYLVAESLGTGPAAHLAMTAGQQVAGLALLAPYNDFQSVGQRQMPFLPVAWLLWDRFDPAAWLKHYHGPVTFVVADADEIIPPELGFKLHDQYAGRKSLLVITGAGHNDVAAQSPEWWQQILTFWQLTKDK